MSSKIKFTVDRISSGVSSNIILVLSHIKLKRIKMNSEIQIYLLV